MIVLKVIGWAIVVALIVYILKLAFSEACQPIGGDNLDIKTLIKLGLALAVVPLMVSLLNYPFTLTGITHAWMLARNDVGGMLIICMILMMIDTFVTFVGIKRSIEEGK